MLPLSKDSTYSDRQFLENYPPGIEYHYWNRRRNFKIQSLLKGRMNAEQPPMKSSEVILDVGCGRGVVLDWLRARRFNCLGVEKGNPPVPPHLTPYISVGATARELPHALRSEVSVVLLCDVLEHLPNPGELLLECQEAFANLKYILITVPGRNELWSNYDEYFGHYRRYDLHSLRTLLEEGGLDILEIGYFFQLLYPLMWITTKVFGRRRKINYGEVKPRWLHRLFSEFLAMEDILLPKTFYGSSLYAVCRCQ